MTIARHLAIQLLVGVVCDNGIMQGKHGYEGSYSETDCDDLTIALAVLDTEFGLLDFMEPKFSHFEGVEQSDRLIDWIVAPEHNDWEEFVTLYPEYQPISEVLNRPFS